MSKVLLELSVSLDGFVAGPDIGPDAPLGRGGERLHDWMFAGKSATDSESFETAHFSEIGALILRRRMADLGIGPWGEEPTFHAPCSLSPIVLPRRSSRRAAPRIYLRHRRD